MKVLSALIAVAITGAFLFMIYRVLGTFLKKKDDNKRPDES
jgi:hypothetical protein